MSDYIFQNLRGYISLYFQQKHCQLTTMQKQQFVRNKYSAFIVCLKLEIKTALVVDILKTTKSEPFNIWSWAGAAPGHLKDVLLGYTRSYRFGCLWWTTQFDTELLLEKELMVIPNFIQLSFQTFIINCVLFINFWSNINDYTIVLFPLLVRDFIW